MGWLYNRKVRKDKEKTPSEYLDELGDLLGVAREELEAHEFLRVLIIEKTFTALMFSKEAEAAGLGRLEIEAMDEDAHRAVSNHLRSVGIEV